MRALILAAGLGTRLRPLTETVPKCLVPLGGRPLLDHWLELLLGSGVVERVLVNTSWLSEVVRAHVAASPWREQVELVHEARLLGTGGTVLANRDWFGPGPLMVIYGDNLSRFDPAAFLACHRSRPAGCVITMMTFITDTPRSCGIVVLDQRGIVQAFHEKVADPPGNQANAAVFIFEPAVIERIATLGTAEIDLSCQVLPLFLGRIATFPNTVYHRDIGTPESLSRAQRDLARLGEDACAIGSPTSAGAVGRVRCRT